MSNRRIANLSAVLTADVRQYDSEMKRAAAIARNTQTAVVGEMGKISKKLGAGGFAGETAGLLQFASKFGVGTASMAGGLAAVAAQAVNVTRNIESIQGVNPGTVASVVRLRDSLSSAAAGAKSLFDRLTAGAIAAAADGLAAVGAGAAMVMGASASDVEAGLRDNRSVTQIERDRDPARYDGLEKAARDRFTAVSRTASRAGMSDVQQIRALREEAARYSTFSESNNQTSIAQIEARTRAVELSAEADQKLLGLRNQLSTAEEQLSKAMTGANVATLSNRDAVEALQAQASRAYIELAKLQGANPSDPEALQRRIDLTKALTENQRLLGKAYAEQSRTAREAGSTIASALEGAIFEARSLSDALKNLASDLLRLVFRNEITEPLSGLLSGGIKSLLGIPGRATGGPVYAGSPYIVGERGPELMVPQTAGTIVPNSALASGGRSRGNVYNIDARGTDESVVMRLQDALFALAGPGVVERRAVSAVMDGRARGMRGLG